MTGVEVALACSFLKAARVYGFERLGCRVEGCFRYVHGLQC